MKKTIPVRLDVKTYKALKKKLVDLDLSFQQLIEQYIQNFINK